MFKTKDIKKVSVTDKPSELNKKSVETKKVNGKLDMRSKEFVQNNEKKEFEHRGMAEKEKAKKTRPGWSNDQQKFLRNVAKMPKEEAQKLGIPSSIHGYLVNELHRANKMARMIRKEGSVEAVKKKYPNIKTTNKGLRSPFKGQYDVGHIKPHVMGGSNKSENLRFELASDNQARGPREKAVNKKIKAKKEVNDPEN